MLTLHNISVSLEKKLILRDVSFSARRGEVLGLIGPNGAGKSTALKTISRLIAPSKGQVLWKGLPMANYPMEEMARWRAVMTQSIVTANNFNVEEVVMMGRYPYFKNRPNGKDYTEVFETIEALGLSKLSKQRIGQLSGGEKQRVHLARVLAQLSYSTGKNEQAQLLLLDEPLNNLDIKHQFHCLQLAQNFASRGNIVVMVLHDINLACTYASSLCLLKEGRVLAYGPTSEVGTAYNFSQCYDLEAEVHSIARGCRVDFKPEKQPSTHQAPIEI